VIHVLSKKRDIVGGTCPKKNTKVKKRDIVGDRYMSCRFVQGTIIQKKNVGGSSLLPIILKKKISHFKISQFLIYFCSVGTYGIGTDGTFGTMVP